jgi:DNA-binding beta-propeller fold protein YncE
MTTPAKERGRDLALAALLAVAAASCGQQGTPAGPSSGPPRATPEVVYVAHPQGISAYAIDGGTGALAALPGSPFGPAPATEYGPLTLDPPGRFLYLTDRDAPFGRVSVIRPYAIEPGGALTAVAPLSGVGSDLVPDPVGRFLYVLDHVASPPRAFGFRIDAALRSFTALAGSPFAFPSSRGGRLTVDPAGRFAYFSLFRYGANAPCEGPGAVHGYAIDPQTGVLEAMPGFPVATGVAPARLAFVGQGSRAYLLNAGDDTQLYGPCPEGSITGYDVSAADGTLAELPGSPFVTGRYLRAYGSAPFGASLYVAWNEQITRYAAQPATGGLLATASQPVPRYTTGTTVEVDAIDQRVFVLVNVDSGAYWGDNELHVYRTDAAGSLEFLEEIPLGGGDMRLKVAPKGRYLYILDPLGARVRAYIIDPGTARLRPVSGSPFPTAAGAFGLEILQ